MIKRCQAELVNALKSQEGYRFTEFEHSTISNCEISDSDWNYKDIPHLKHIHHLVEGYPAYAGSDFISAILVQKVFGIKFPAVLFNYQSGQHRQTYYITMMLYVLIVETTYESLGINRTRTTTRYAVGCKSWLASLLFPLCRLAIKRNFDNLMSGDLPMRERRGLLRSWGYSFKGDNKPYSFFETSLIMESNVIPPSSEQSRKEHLLELTQLKAAGKILLGKSDQFGLSIHEQAGQLNFFERLCPHEGADLSHNCDGKQATCEWHGRKFKPVFSVISLELQVGFQKSFGDRYVVSVPKAGFLKVSIAPMSNPASKSKVSEPVLSLLPSL